MKVNIHTCVLCVSTAQPVLVSDDPGSVWPFSSHAQCMSYAIISVQITSEIHCYDPLSILPARDA